VANLEADDEDAEREQLKSLKEHWDDDDLLM
jgi:hypothetical protein